MIASAFVYRRALAIAACLLIIAGSPLGAQEARLPEPIRLALARYAELAPLAVTWTQTTEATPLGQEKLAADVLSRIVHDGSSVQQLAFRDGRIYIRRETRDGSSWPPRNDEIAYDRNLLCAAHNLFYAGDPGSHDPKDRPYLHKWLPKNDQPETSYFRSDYFRAAGVRLPVRTKELVKSLHPQSELLALLNAGGKVQAISSANLDGRPLIRVEMTTHHLQAGLEAATRKFLERFDTLERYKFYFDPQRGYVLCRLDIRDEVDRLLTRFDCTDFEQLSGRQIWMPRRCRVEEYAVTATAQDEEALILDVLPSPLYVKTIQVNAFDVQPWPHERFQLKYTTPGVYVNDASFPEMTGKDGIFYQIPANPERLDEVIAVRRAFYQAWLRAEKKSRPLRVMFLILNGVGFAGLAVYLFVRRRKRASCT